MSTKIYNAYRIKGLDSVHDLYQMALQIHSRSQLWLDNYICHVVGDAFSRDFDRLRGEKCCPKSMVQDIVGSFHTGKHEEMLYSPCDLNVSLYVVPYDGYIYGTILSSHSHLCSNILQDMGWEEFSYWNNTDCHDGVTEDEWDSRAEIWDKIFHNKRSWSDIAMKFDLSYPVTQLLYGGFDFKSIIFPSLEKRAMSVVLDDHLKAYDDSPRGQEDPFGYYGERMKFVSSEGFKIRCEEVKSTLEPDLHQVLEHNENGNENE